MKAKIYPFKDLIRQNIGNLSIDSLASAVGKSRQWVYDRTIENTDLADTLKISEVLNFNFLADYNRWLLDNEMQPIYPITFNEPSAPYVLEKKIATHLKITAGISKYEKFKEMLEAIEKAGDKFGFYIEEEK